MNMSAMLCPSTAAVRQHLAATEDTVTMVLAAPDSTDVTVGDELDLTNDPRAALDGFWDHISDWARVRAPELVLHILAWATADQRRIVERETRGLLAFLTDHLELLSDTDADLLFARLQDLEEWAADKAGSTPWAEWSHV
jgi:hypothetical protein